MNDNYAEARAKLLGHLASNGIVDHILLLAFRPEANVWFGRKAGHVD